MSVSRILPGQEYSIVTAIAAGRAYCNAPPLIPQGQKCKMFLTAENFLKLFFSQKKPPDRKKSGGGVYVVSVKDRLHPWIFMGFKAHQYLLPRTLFNGKIYRQFLLAEKRNRCCFDVLSECSSLISAQDKRL